MTTESIAPILSASVSPMLVISAAGLLLLSMTNRYARVIDRARAYRQQIAGFADGSKEAVATKAQLSIVWERARLLRLSITLTTMSVLGVVLVVIGLFVHLLSGWNTGTAILVVFGISMATLAVALVVFVRDMTLSLNALENEIREYC